MLYPIAPHFSSECWELLLKEGPSHHLDQFEEIATAPWPSVDPLFLSHDQKVTLVVQINGKKRALLSVQKSFLSQQKQIELLALQEDNVKKHLENKNVKKVFFSEKGPSINFVI